MSLITDLHEIETDINIIRQKVGLPASATLANIAQAVGTGGGSSLPTFYHFNNLVERDQATAGLKDGDIAFVYGEKQNADLLPSMVGAIVTNIKLPLEIRNIPNYTLNTGTFNLRSISDSKEYINIYRNASNLTINIYGRDILQIQGGAGITGEYGRIILTYIYNNVSDSFKLSQATEQNYAIYEHHQLKNDYKVLSGSHNLVNEDFKGFNVFDIKDIEGLYELNQGNWETFDLKVNTYASQLSPNARAITNNGIVYGTGVVESPGLKASRFYSTLHNASQLDLSYAFNGMAFDINPLVNRVSTNKITNMSHCFNGCYTVTSIPNAANWDTSEVRDMSCCFAGCVNLTGTPTTNWNTSNVTNLSNFAQGINGISNWWNGLNNFNTENVRDMSYCFYGLSNLQTLRLNNWTTPNVINMSGMFSHEYNLTTLYIPLFNTHNVQRMDSMFSYTQLLNIFSLFKSFDKSSLISATSIFVGAVQNKSKAWNSPDLSNLYMPEIATLSNMFNSCNGLTGINLGNIYAPNITNTAYMFAYCSNVTTINLTNLDTHNVTNFDYMFAGCSNLTTIQGLENGLDTTSAKTLSNVFGNCFNLQNVYNIILNYNTSNLTSITYLFGSTFNLSGKDINLTHWNVANLNSISSIMTSAKANQPNSINLSGWDVSNVTNLGGCFYNIGYSVDVTGWNTCNVNIFANLFGNCDINKAYDILNVFNFSNAEQLPGIFSGCTSITSFDFNSFKGLNETNSPIDIRSAFSMCFNLTDINLSYLNETQIERMDGLFNRCSNLTNIVGLNTINTDKCYAMNFLFNGCYNVTDTTVNQFLELNFEGVESLRSAFCYCQNITTVNFQNKYLPDCVEIVSLFAHCANLTSVNFNNTTIGDFCSFVSAFENCRALSQLGLNFNEEVHITSFQRSFNNCQNLTDIDLSKCNFSNTNSFLTAFSNCYNLTNVELPHTIINTSSSISFNNMFSYCNNLTTLNLSNLICNTSYPTTVSGMFSNCNSYVSTHLEDICDFVMRFNVNSTMRNLSNTNTYSPIYNTNVQVNSSTVSAETLSRLSLIGWTY